jgi:hypothetical protein
MSICPSKKFSGPREVRCHNCQEIVKVTDERVNKEIDINTEVLGIVNGEIVKVTDQ